MSGAKLTVKAPEVFWAPLLDSRVSYVGIYIYKYIYFIDRYVVKRYTYMCIHMNLLVVSREQE